MIEVKPLPYISYDIDGGLNALQIGPLPNPGSGIITTNTIFINAPLPDLGHPGTPKPGGPGGGQYIEILIDDEPANSRITTQVPHVIQLPNGTHMLQFLLSSGDGECIKEDNQTVCRVVHINSITRPTLSDLGPMIIYNLPRAAHRGDDVILDFGLVNVLTDPVDINGHIRIRDYDISVRLDETELTKISEANTHRISGLTNGRPYKIELVLVHRINGELDPLLHPHARTKIREFVPR